MFLSGWGFGFWLIGLVLAVFVVWHFGNRMRKARNYLNAQGRQDAAEFISAELREFLWTAAGIVAILVLTGLAVYLQLRPH